MDTNKAKAAKKKAKRVSAARKQVDPATAQALMQGQMGMGVPGLTPEVAGIGLGEQSDLQPIDGMYNPYHRLGSVNPNYYNPGNVIGGF
jgi:hypothetical protein